MMLRIGSTGADVRNLQELLNFSIPFQPLLVLDGIFGPKTNQRVIAFQKQNGLMADGIAGPMTGKALVGRVLQTLKPF
ncbi:MAG: peptidoglycan-binding protein [Acidobacteria bacterium]|nr:peptidoglycan-binding protein [Acidobacteriota bacterium]